MYPVSEAFLEAVQSNTRHYVWSGSITTLAGSYIEFTEKEIVKGSGYLTAQCCGSTELELGTVYSSEMGITLFLEIDRYSLEGAKVELYYHLLTSAGSYEIVPMGIFEVSEANRGVRYIEIKAYDYMLRFETDVSVMDTVGNAYEIITWCCSACNVTFAQSQEEIEALPNGTTSLSIYTENDIETYRDILFYIGQVLGGFFIINRVGELQLIKYGCDPVIDIESKHRFSSTFSDFITRYTAIYVTNLNTEVSEYYALDEDDGLTMSLGSNPFLQYGLDTVREALWRNILADISMIQYVPFDSETIGNPALDLGDIIQFRGGNADESQITCITSSQIIIGGKQTIKCVGKNPMLSQAKSKTDKTITGLLNQISEVEVNFFSFTNATVFTLTETEVKVIDIDFASGEATQAEFQGTVLVEAESEKNVIEETASGTIIVPIPIQLLKEKLGLEEVADDEESLDVSVEVNLPMQWEQEGKVILKARYVLNDTNVELFYPTESLGDGKHIIPLYYPIGNVLPNLLNNFSVYLSASGGTASIEQGDCIATISGQGLVAASAEWDGKIEVEDTIGRMKLCYGGVQLFTEAVQTEDMVPKSVALGEQISQIRLGGFPMVIESGGL